MPVADNIKNTSGLDFLHGKACQLNETSQTLQHEIIISFHLAYIPSRNVLTLCVTKSNVMSLPICHLIHLLGIVLPFIYVTC